MTTGATQPLILSKANRDVHSADHHRRIGHARGPAELARLAEHLPAADRTLITWVCREGLSLTEVALLLRQTRRRIGHRVASITRRMLSPEFALCILHASDWPRDTRRIAELCVLGGCSLTRAAREIGVSIHTARRLHADITAMTRGVRLASELNSTLNKGGDTWRGTSLIAREPRWRRSA